MEIPNLAGIVRSCLPLGRADLSVVHLDKRGRCWRKQKVEICLFLSSGELSHVIFVYHVYCALRSNVFRPAAGQSSLLHTDFLEKHFSSLSPAPEKL